MIHRDPPTAGPWVERHQLRVTEPDSPLAAGVKVLARAHQGLIQER
ncbi:hypothetical protein EV644_1081, partial [Kribbella orskensis]